VKAPRFSRLNSPLGMLCLVTDGPLLLGLDFDDGRARLLSLLERQLNLVAMEEGPAPAPVAAALEAYFAGALDALASLQVTLGGTTFQREVWQALREIPPGSTRSYGALAAQLGKPAAARAVGLANGANPVALVLPCHRVIGSDGTLTGYAGGLARKQWLLAHEGALLL
jgi:O-6-methylguanine DNA methyltransferase